MPKKSDYIHESMVLSMLRAEQGGRSQREFAAILGIAPSLLSEIYAGKYNINEEILSHLGLEDAGRVYRKKKGKRV